MDAIRALKRAAEHGECVTMELTGPAATRVEGVPLAVGRGLVLMRTVQDFDVDGYQVVARHAVNRVRSDEHERFLERVLRDEGQLRRLRAGASQRAKPTLPLSGWRGLCRTLEEREELVIVECEGRETDSFLIGPIVAVTSELVSIHHFDATAVWDLAPTTISFGDITRVRFGERYTQVYARYVGARPK
jgi:hypothetical protein